MGIFDFNFSFGTKQSKNVRELSTDELSKAKFQARIAIVDDEEVPNMENLQNDGYNTLKYSDILNMDEFINKKHHVLILDIQGVGKKLAGDLEGWGLLEYLKKEHPHIVVIVFTGADWSITKFKERADMADFIIGKDSEYLNFKMKVDAAIKKAFSVSFHLEVLKNQIDNSYTDKSRIEEVIREYGMDQGKTMKKIRKITKNEASLQSADNVLSIISSIYSFIPA
jgi:DNA-binding NtrC family response regulator